MSLKEQLINAINNVVNNADDTGCSDDLTVTSQSAIEKLAELLPQLKDYKATVEVTGGVAEATSNWELVEIIDHDIDDA